MVEETNLLNDFVVGQRNPLLVELSVTSLVDQLPDTLEVRVPTQIMNYTSQQQCNIISSL